MAAEAPSLLSIPGETAPERTERLLVHLVRTQEQLAKNQGGVGVHRWLPVLLTGLIAAVGAAAAYFGTVNEARNATAAAERLERLGRESLGKLEADLVRRVDEAKQLAVAAALSAQQAKDLARDKGDEAVQKLNTMQVTLAEVKTLVNQLVKAADEERLAGRTTSAPPK